MGGKIRVHLREGIENRVEDGVVQRADARMKQYQCRPVVDEHEGVK